MSQEAPLSVLIIEDDFMVASVHRAFTERIPDFMVCGVAHTGREALALLEQHKPDLVLLDVYMPDLTGLQVLWEMRQRRLQSDVIFITAARDVETVREAMRGGAVRYIVKPFGFAKFESTLTDYVRLRSHLGSNPMVDQVEIDRFYGLEMAVRPADSLPKGLSENTLRLVEGFLRRADRPATAEEVAEGVGVTRVTARRYLEFLAGAGKAKFDVRYGAVGRPEHRYTVRKNEP
jgi:response regulator of citrate/malate metabolism